MTKTAPALETFPGEPATRFYISEADELTETRFYFAEPDGCYICGQPFSGADIEQGLEWLMSDAPVHGECMRQHEAGSDDWRGSMTL